MKKKSKEKEMAFLYLEEFKLGLAGRVDVSLNQEKKDTTSYQPTLLF